MNEKFMDRSNRDLDRRLKEISDSAEIPFSEQNWEEMSARLDRQVKPSRIDSFLKGLAWLGGLASAVLIGFLIWNGDMERVSQSSNSDFVDRDQAQVSLPISENESELRQSRGKEREVALMDTSAVEPLKLPASGWEQSTPALLTDQQGIKQASYELDFSSPNQGTETFRRWIPERFPEWERISVSNESMSIPDASKEGAIPTEKSEIDEQKEKSKENKFGGGFSISVQGAPDLSGIKLDQLAKTGQMVGLGVEYFLSPKTSLTTGLFYSFKPYRTEEGYNSSYGSQPDLITGECAILDIPLNLRFYPLEGRVQRAFVGLGLSSYLMLSERYDFEYYGDAYSGSYTEELEVKGKNNHFFGVMNLSVGYERKLGGKLSVQVEPYFKVPLKGVGEGDLSLKSTGLLIGLKFYPSGLKTP